jgi:PDZ domain-containing protein
MRRAERAAARNRLVKGANVNKRCTTFSLLLLVALAAGAAATAAPEPPAPPAPESRPGSEADLEAQLEAARKRLEQAAHEVARLSGQMSGTMIEQLMPSMEMGRAIIGVQLEPAPEAGGARVREVSPGGPAAEAGIRAGDVIVAVNGTDLKESEPARQVVRIMRDVKPESRVSVRLLREGKTRDVTLTARPGPGALAMAHVMPDMDFGPQLRGAFMFHGSLRDMELASLTPRLGSYFGSDKGVLVVRAPEDGALKLEDGDVILAIDGREPTSGSHATRILGSYQPGEKLTLRIVRQHKTQEIQVTLPEHGGHAHKDMMWREASPHAVPAPRVLVLGSDAA